MINTITYATIVDIVKNYAKNNCVNITNFSGMPSCYKSGFSYTVGTYSKSGTNVSISETFKISGISNPIVQVSSSTVDTDMTNFLTSIGISSSQLSYPIDDANLENFLMDMIIFASTKICFAVSQSSKSASSDRRIVYLATNTSYGTVYKVYPKSQGNGLTHTYNSTEIQNLINGFFNNIKKSIRVAPITFSFSIT